MVQMTTTASSWSSILQP